MSDTPVVNLMTESDFGCTVPEALPEVRFAVRIVSKVVARSAVYDRLHRGRESPDDELGQNNDQHQPAYRSPHRTLSD
jgi:hypothetical protein